MNPNNDPYMKKTSTSNDDMPEEFESIAAKIKYLNERAVRLNEEKQNLRSVNSIKRTSVVESNNNKEEGHNTQSPQRQRSQVVYLPNEPSKQQSPPINEDKTEPIIPTIKQQNKSISSKLKPPLKSQMTVQQQNNNNIINDLKIDPVEKDNDQVTESKTIDKSPIGSFNKETQPKQENHAKTILQLFKNINTGINTIKDQNSGNSEFKNISKSTQSLKDEVLSSVKVPIDIVNESFCEGFFIASLPKEGNGVENSEGLKAACGHDVCSELPAMQPEIIYRYPEKDTKTLELNNLAASICFPTGLKVCHEQKDPVSVKNFMSPITNQYGSRYYMMTYHLFYKMLYSEYVKNYSMHSLKYQIIKYNNEFFDSNEEETTKKDKKEAKKIKQEIERKIELCTELGYSEIIYVPYCLCLISKYPYLKEMEKALESMRNQMSTYRSSTDDIINEVIYLVKSIPIPSLNSKVTFALPHSCNILELFCPKYLDLDILDKRINILFDVLSIENIVLIFRLMILEQKILFVDNEYNHLSQITNSFVSLLYPLTWISPYIAIMSDQMIKYLQAFQPFLNGIHEHLFETAKQTLSEAEEGVYIIYLAKDTIDINSNISSKKVKIKNVINEKVPALPRDYEAKLIKELKRIKGISDKKNKSTSEIDIMIQNCFISFYVEILYDYDTFTTVIDDYPQFNTKCLLEARPQEDARFYQEFTDTQMFQQFIQTISSSNDKIYFNQIIKTYDAKKKYSSYENNNLGNVLESLNRIDHCYIIKPYFLPGDEAEELNKDCISAKLNKMFPQNENQINENGVLKECHRIIGSLKPINNIDKPTSTYTFYQIPGIIVKIQDDGNDKPNKIAMRADIFERRDKQNMISNRTCKYINGKRPEWEFSEYEKDDIKEAIKDILSKVFKSESIDQIKDKKLLLSSIDNSFGRNYFINSIYQNKTTGKTIKTINDESFILFENVFFNALLGILKLEDNQKNNECIVKIIKASMQYCKNEKKQQILLADCLCPKLNNYSRLPKVALWDIWYDIEIMEGAESKNKSSIDDKLISKTLEEILKIMLKLKIAKDFIFKIVTEKGSAKFKDVKNIAVFKKLAETTMSKVKY